MGRRTGGTFLFAVTARLVAESYKDLREEPPFRTEKLLDSILRRLNQPDSSSVGFPARVPFKPPVNAIAANALFFPSLTVSLLAALGAILVKQWTRRVYVGLNAIISSRRGARAHYLRMQGIKDWRLSETIPTVPMLLHVSLFLFLAGLVVWLYGLHTLVFILILTTTVLGLAIYLMAAMIPSFWPDAPFHWPVSSSFEALYNVFHNRRQKRSTDFLPLHDKSTTTITANTNLRATDKILVTYLVQNTSLQYDSPDAGFDGLDMKILLELSKHTESPTQTDAIIDQFRRGMAHEYRTGHISESLDEQSITAIIQKAAECALSCRMNQNDIRSGIFLEQATTMMQSFEVALQVLEFTSEARKGSLVSVAEMANLLMDRALFMGSVDEIALSASVIARAQAKLDRWSHLERAERVLVALRELGPRPQNPESQAEDEFEWTQERVERYQRSISAHILSLTYLGVHFHTSSSSRGGAGVHQAQESSIQALANEVSAALRAGRFPEKMSCSGGRYTPLRDAISVLWINLLSSKVTRWMERVIPPVGWIPKQAADGTHVLEGSGM
ncbi:hypothetical protein FRC17_003579 [Serendipita sp. 399]|nr:hypothetical protein FRC17_003579 [Serendipita sp. 399]